MLPVISILILAKYIFLLHFVSGLGWSYTLKDGALNTVVMSLAIWGIILIVNAYPTQVGAQAYALIIATVICIAITYADNQILEWWLGKDKDYLTWLDKTLPVHLIINWIILGWVATYTVTYKKAETLEAKFVKHTDAAQLLKDAELFKLRQQLQPHFLYNSLNSINALVMIQPDKAQEMIGRLSDFLRSSVKREAEDMIPVAEELTFIEAYLAIEAVRFGDRLNIEFKHDYTDHATIPPFLLQPLLENAIKFGLYGKTGNVTISVHIALIDQMLQIMISNPYDVQTNTPKGTGFGLEGIRRRLELLYARTDLLEVKKDADIFTTILNIPQANA